jgi:signal transduction histidine kinase
MSNVPWATRIFAGAAGAYGLVWAVVLFSGALTGSSSVLLTSGMYTAASLLAGSAIVWLSRHVKAGEKRAWLLIGTGTLSWALADGIWGAYEAAMAEVPYPGLPDVFYLTAYPLWLGGLLAFPYARGSRFAQWRLVLDGMAGTGALALLMWDLYLKDVVSFEGGSILERLVNPAYPLGDVLLLSGLVIVSVRRSPHRLHRPLLLLAAGTLCNATADILYWVNFDDYASGGRLDGLWILAYGLFALAAWSATKPARNQEFPDRPVSPRSLVVPYTLVMALMALAGYQVVTGDGSVESKIIELGAGVVAFVVILRQSIALREFGELVERERRDLVASLSHELRTPLTAMSGFSELLSDQWEDFPDEERRELVTSVAGQTRYLSRIVTDLIELSRNNLAKAQLSIAWHRLADVVGEAIVFANVPPQAVKAEVAPDLVIRADRARIIQILVNLITNAARYGRGATSLIARATTGGVRIEVHDDGPGVPVKYRELIWERFERGAQRYNAARPGTGLGLAIAKGLVQAHGGAISYEDSDLLGGACFVVFLPQRTTHEATSTPALDVAGWDAA